MSDIPPKNNDLKVLNTSFLEYMLAKVESNLWRRSTPLDAETHNFIEDLHNELAYRTGKLHAELMQGENPVSTTEENNVEDSPQDKREALNLESNNLDTETEREIAKCHKELVNKYLKYLEDFEKSCDPLILDSNKYTETQLNNQQQDSTFHGQHLSDEDRLQQALTFFDETIRGIEIDDGTVSSFSTDHLHDEEVDEFCKQENKLITHYRRTKSF